jgi:hypothetical protein
VLWAGLDRTWDAAGGGNQLLTHQDASPERWWSSCACSARERVGGWESNAREEVGVACVCRAVAGSLCGACVCVWGLDACSLRVAGAVREWVVSCCQASVSCMQHLLFMPLGSKRWWARG